MKRIIALCIALVMLASFAVVPQTVIHAAADATCVSDPAAGPVGTVFEITCSGFTPNSYVYAYLVEPAGVAVTLFESDGAIKANEKGAIVYEQESKFEAFATLQVGTWHFVAEETGLAKTVLHRGETTFTITGGTESVSGAELEASPTTIHKPAQAYDRFTFPSFTLSALAFSEPVKLEGKGFEPNEMVTFWLEPAGGGCATMTRHQSADAGEILPGVAAIYVHQDINSPIYDGYGAQEFAGRKANAAGEVEAEIAFTSIACEGQWRMVARGNASHHGAQTWVTVTGNAVTTNAVLEATPSSASAMFATIQFNGSGFGSGEHVSCWLTTPQGQTLGYPDELFMSYFSPTKYVRKTELFADARGDVNFSFVSGNVYDHTSVTYTVGGIAQNDTHTEYAPMNSEGALGEYAMSCRGDTTGNTAIARFTLTGGIVDP